MADPSPSPSTTADKPLDPAFYTWSTFFSILTNTASPNDRTQYFRTKDRINEAADCARCDKDKAWLFAYSPIIRFLTHQISLLGPEDGSASITPANPRARDPGLRQPSPEPGTSGGYAGA
ncbi:Mitochondrial inner membrane protease atp23 [Elasticomyces elasticus]|nr:Mitochondrial inner membrane protease atp23 [Elasticomyces elasticus]KAK3654908.1 Mitochondrial inner membrane protease atp23 [Elasticomyces elasticus]KAK4928762.1 Mitochondrial inner membrane protease atp23 [Elasticomyces elasticus]KAK5766611.1 Mitochondrial inner membrane protease atp23 [Elasticomyces elasticus]